MQYSSSGLTLGCKFEPDRSAGDQLKSLADITVLRMGGHFPGSCVLHWPGGSDGKGTLFSGDTIQVVPDNK